MTGRQYKDLKKSFSKSIKMKLQCIGSVITRSLCPFDEEVKNKYKQNKHELMTYFLYAVTSFLLGISLPNGDLSPFALSMLCASFGKNTLFSYIGACFSCFFYGIDGLIQFVAFSLVFLLRRSISNAEFNESSIIRIVLAGVFSAFTGAVILFKMGIDLSSVIGLCTYVILCSLCTALFSIFSEQDKSRKSNSLYLLAIYSVFVCLIPSFNRLSFLGVDLGLLFSCVSALYFAKGKGAVFGCVAGFIFGFACRSPLICAPLGMSSLCAGYIFPKSTPFTFFSFLLVFCISYIYLFGSGSMVYVIPIVCASCLIFASVHRFLPDIFPRIAAEKFPSVKAVAKKDEFQKVSESLSGLSSLIYKFAEHMKAPSHIETGLVFDEALCKTCETCSMNEMCYAKRESNLSNVRKDVISTLHSSVLSKGHMSKLLLGKCIKVSELTESINSAYSDLRFIAMKANRTQTVASIYSSMSRLIKSTDRAQEDNNRRDTHLESQISLALNKIGVEHSFVEAKGTRCKEVFIHGVRAEKIPCSAKDLALYLSGECRLKFTEPVFDISESADMVMKLYRDERVKLEFAQCHEAKKKGTVSGDTLQFFDTDSGLFYAIIADGMGSGKTAAATSRLSCVFMEKMLKGGASRNVCIEMLNSLLLSKNDETFACLDMLEIDKICCTAHFIKAGAAPSFVLRKSHLYKITSETPPVGIIPTFSAESTRFSLEQGDIIIMVSDGVISGDDDGIWLSELIHLDTECEPAYLASLLIDRAKELNERKDDATACVIKVEF